MKIRQCDNCHREPEPNEKRTRCIGTPDRPCHKMICQYCRKGFNGPIERCDECAADEFLEYVEPFRHRTKWNQIPVSYQGVTVYGKPMIGQWWG